MGDTFIVNELLAFVFFKYNSDNRTDIQSALCAFYGDEDVSGAKTLLHQHYEDIIGPKQGRQNRGAKSLKEKEIDDILDGVKKIDENGSQRPVKFVALNLVNLPSLVLPQPASSPPAEDVRPRVSILEMQVAELLKEKMTTRDHSSQSTDGASSSALGPRKQPTAPLPQQPNKSWSGVIQAPAHGLQQQGMPSLPIVSYDASGAVMPLRPQGGGTRKLDKDSFITKESKKRKKRTITYGSRDGQAFKAAPRRHHFVVSNAPHGTSIDVVKSYIVDSNVDVLDIKRLSEEAWNTQSFWVTILLTDEPTVKADTFWPKDIGYRRYFIRKRAPGHFNQTNSNGSTTR